MRSKIFFGRDNVLPVRWVRHSEKTLRSMVLLIVVLSCLFPSNLLAQDASRRDAVVVATEKVGPAVVSIFSAQEVRQSRTPFGGDPFFDQFFRDFFEPFPQRRTQRSLGSGVVIRPDGYILTNEHVILRSGKIQVQFADERQFDARLVGADSDSDLAVLKIDKVSNLPHLPLGSSDDLMIGETVIAIGNPFGLSHTVTTGVVSAVDRSLNTNGRTYYDFIQTDASINPGNSGGPLLNIKGDLIGINTAIYGRAQGIGFAIPISRAKRIVRELITHGMVETPWIGVVVQTLTPELAHHFDLPGKRGVVVRGVEAGSPAAHAGVQRGDVLLSLDSRSLRSAEEYIQQEHARSSGDTLRFRVLRDGKEKEVTIKAARFPQEQADDLAWRLLGIKVAETANGLQVQQMRPGSPVTHIGMEQGDLILGLSGVETNSLVEFRRQMIEARLGQAVLLSVGRGRQLYHVTVPLAQE
jgi:serine protease Do